MSEFETDTPSRETPVTEPIETPLAEQPACKPGRPWWAKLLIGVGVVVVTLVLLLVLLYNFGGMGGSANDPEMAQQYEELLAAGDVGPVEQRFVIPIPGCTCHSDDPYLTEQHRNRRIKECGGCHGGGGPQ